MTKNEQAVAVARACPGLFVVFDGHVYWKNKVGEPEEVDICGDWNAIHFAVNSLTESQRLQFTGALDVITSRRTVTWLPHQIVTSTIPEWVEAFLRTFDLWHE